MRKWRFLAVFLVAFGVILGVWGRTPAPRLYTDAMLGGAALVGPLLHGWVLELPGTSGGRPTWVHGAARVELQVQLDSLAVGVVPLLALLIATPGVSWRRRARQILLGLIGCFAVDCAILALFPLLVFYKNPFTDVVGTWIGLVGFVGAPVILWFTLAFSEIRQWLPRLRRDGAQASQRSR